MGIRRERSNQIPNEELEELMVYIANFKFPGDDDSPWRATSDDAKEFLARLRAKTEKYWPALWQPVRKGNISVEQRAEFVIRKMRGYLHLFWQASDADRERARDWYIHRAREYHYRL